MLKGSTWSSELLLGLAVGMGLLLFFAVFLLHMTTEVTPADVRVWFGWVPVYRRVVPLGDIRRVELVSFRPIADYGFWGVRSGRDGERALIARGQPGRPPRAGRRLAARHRQPAGRGARPGHPERACGRPPDGAAWGSRTRPPVDWPGARTGRTGLQAGIPMSGQITPARNARWNRIGSGRTSQLNVHARPIQGVRSIGRPARAHRRSTRQSAHAGRSTRAAGRIRPSPAPDGQLVQHPRGEE